MSLHEARPTEAGPLQHTCADPAGDQKEDREWTKDSHWGHLRVFPAREEALVCLVAGPLLHGERGLHEAALKTATGAVLSQRPACTAHVGQPGSRPSRLQQ